MVRKENQIKYGLIKEVNFITIHLTINNSWLRDNNIEVYSTHNEGKFVVAERSIGL